MDEWMSEWSNGGNSSRIELKCETEWENPSRRWVRIEWQRSTSYEFQ